MMKDPSIMEKPMISEEEMWLLEQDDSDKPSTSVASQLQGFVRASQWASLNTQMEEDDIITAIHHSLKMQMDDEEVAINHYVESTSAPPGPAQDMEVTEEGGDLKNGQASTSPDSLLAEQVGKLQLDAPAMQSAVPEGSVVGPALAEADMATLAIADKVTMDKTQVLPSAGSQGVQSAWLVSKEVQDDQGSDGVGAN